MSGRRMSTDPRDGCVWEALIVLSRLKEAWSAASAQERENLLRTLHSSYDPPRDARREPLADDRAVVSFLADVLEEDAQGDEVVCLAVEWLLDHVDGNPNQLVETLRHAFFPFDAAKALQNVAQAAARTGRYELSHAAFLALRKRDPSRWLELTTEATKVLVTAGERERAEGFARTALGDLETEERTYEAAQYRESLSKAGLAVPASAEEEVAGLPIEPQEPAPQAERSASAPRLEPESDGNERRPAGETSPSEPEGIPRVEDMPDVIDAKQAAVLLGIKPTTVYDWAKRKKIPKIDYEDTNVVRFRKAELLEWRESQTRPAQPTEPASVNLHRPRRRRS
ncbi:helix-turn-helix domain-containing protein [Planctomycetota bacterium]